MIFPQNGSIYRRVASQLRTSLGKAVDSVMRGAWQLKNGSVKPETWGDDGDTLPGIW